MRKKISFIITICIAVCVAAIMGNIYGKYKKEKELPVCESMAIYPQFSMPELVETSSTIVNATVVEVGDTYMDEIAVSLTEDPSEASEVIYNPITPITLEIETSLKGSEEDFTITYYEEGGTTPTYIQLPDGYKMEEGMEIIIFLNDKGYSWGAQSIFPVIENEVILNETALNHLEEANVSIIDKSTIENSVGRQIADTTVSVMDKDEFLNIIEGLVEN